MGAAGAFRRVRERSCPTRMDTPGIVRPDTGFPPQRQCESAGRDGSGNPPSSGEQWRNPSMMRRRWIASSLLVTMLALLTPGMALASSRGRRNTALALTGGALYTWLNGGFNKAGRRNTALLLTAAAVGGWSKYRKAKRSDRRRARLARLARYSSYGYSSP